MPIKHEVAQAIYALIEAHMDRRDRQESIKTAATDFNLLLRQARAAFPNSRLLPLIAPLRVMDSFATFFTRLAMLKSAVDSEVIRLQRFRLL
jgi:hypothetical protein